MICDRIPLPPPWKQGYNGNVWEPNDVQKNILLKLLTSEQLRYSEIKSKNIANDLFNYHLQFLLKKDLIDKKDNMYLLSAKGIKFLEETRPISRSEGFTPNYRVSILYIVVDNTKNGKTVLVQKRTRKPFFGNVGVPSGKLLKGEPVEDAAERLCFKETGLKTKFQKIGILRSTRYFNNELFSDGFWFVCISTQELINKNVDASLHGENYWVSIEEAVEIEKKSMTSSPFIIQILNLLKTSNSPNLQDRLVEETHTLTSL